MDRHLGSALSGKFSKIKHLTPKKSLQDAFSEDDIKDWYKRIQKLLWNVITRITFGFEQHLQLKNDHLSSYYFK